MFSKEIGISLEVGVVDLFKDLLVSGWVAATGYAKDQYAKNDPFNIATQKYMGSLIERYNNVKVLGMREPVPLESLYVRANILEKISAREGLRPEQLAIFFDFDRRAFGIHKETVDGEKIVNRLQKFIVLGKPGAGKTTYLKYLTLMMLNQFSQIEQRRLPIFVTLREWADEKKPLMIFIQEQFDICGFPKADLFLEKMLADGKCFVLFDGLDEVSQEANQDDIIRQIRNFTDKYARNQFIISCRVAAYNHWFEHFTDVEIADFNEEQMKTFIKNWFSGEPKVATECWERLKNSAPLRELASTPLLLTLLCLEYSESNDFPPNRAELYERAIETLLSKWDSSRRIRRDEVYKNLSLKRKESMFARIAFGTFTKNEYFIRERTLVQMIEQYIEHLPGFNPADLEPDSKAILQAIESRHGIFVERAKDVYSFAHLTFQEYFTAKHIVDTQRDGSLERLVAEHLYNPKWKEVFLLVVGMLDNADELLCLMRKKSEEVLADETINRLFQVAKSSLVDRKNPYPDVIRRNLGVFIAHAFDITIDPGRFFYRHFDTPPIDLDFVRGGGVDFDALARERKNSIDFFHSDLAHALGIALARNLASALDLDDNLARNLARVCDFDLVLTHAHADAYDLAHALDIALARNLAPALDLDLDQLKAYVKANKFNEQNILKTKNYSSANKLILDCLATGCYVSKLVRERLLHGLFLPKEDLGQRGT